MKDLGKLDSVLCNKNERKLFLALISNQFATMEGVFDGFADSSNDKKYCRWLLKRKVSVKHVNLNSATLKVIQSHGNKRKVCSNTTSLNMVMFSFDWAALRASLTLFPKMIKMNFKHCHGIEKDESNHIKHKKASNLVKPLSASDLEVSAQWTHLDFSECAGLAHFILPWLQRAENLEVLSVHRNHTLQVLSMLTNQYLALHTLNLSSCNTVCACGVVEFSKQCPNLTALHLNNCNDIEYHHVAIISPKVSKTDALTLPGQSDET
jgi:hypothetical protein